MWKCTWYSVWIDQEHNQIGLDQHLKIEDISHRQCSLTQAIIVNLIACVFASIMILHVHVYMYIPDLIRM